MTHRGTSNRNARGNTLDRAARRRWLLKTFESNYGEGTCRCWRCGQLLAGDGRPGFQPLTVDRVIPGTQGGKYTRDNIRPACGGCNSETGGALSRGGGR